MSILLVLWGTLITLLGLTASLLVFWYQAWRTFVQLKVPGHNANGISLQRSPTRLSPFELISITISIVTKYLPVFSSMVAKLRPDPTRDQSFALPSILVRGFLDIDDDDFEKFFKAVHHKSPNADKVSPMFLVATTGPLVPYILAQPACPIKPFGAVNTRNTFTIHDPEFCRDVSRIKTASKTHQLTYLVTFGGPEYPGLRKKRGIEFRVNIEILHSEQVVLSLDLYFLQFLKPSVHPKFTSAPAAADVKVTSPAGVEASDQNFRQTRRAMPQISLKINPQQPREWASCCRDYNPIHISAFAAKLFGFKSVIAHGNHAVAIVLQQIYDDPANEYKSAETGASKLVWGLSSPVTIDMKFIKPMLLPLRAHVEWRESRDHESYDFIISYGAVQYTLGTCSSSRPR